MFKLNDTSNDIKDNININLYNIDPLQIINKIEGKRNSLDLTKLSKNSSFSKNKINNSETSLNKIQKINEILSLKDNSHNKRKDSFTYKNNNFPICLSFMTNTKNYISSIDKKFRVRNFPSLSSDFKTVSENNTSLMNNSSIVEKKNNNTNNNNNIINLKLINNRKSKEIKKIMSKINFSINQRKNFFEENNNINNSSVNIKNYNYFIGNIDKSVNIYNQEDIYKKKEKIKIKMQKLKEKEKLKNITINKMNKPNKNYIDLFNNINLKLKLPKKIQKISSKKISLNLNTSIENSNDIVNKETSMNESQINLKLKNTSKIKIPKIENKNEKKEEKIPEKNFEKTGVGGIMQIKNNIEKNETSISTDVQKNFKKTISFANLDEKNEDKKKEIKNKNSLKENKNKRISNKKSSMRERNLQKRISDLKKKSQQRHKINFIGIIIKNKKSRHNEKTNKFLKKLIIDNESEEKLHLSKIVKENKIHIIINKKNSVNQLISNQKDKLNYTKFNYFSKFADLLSIRKNIMPYQEKIIIYKSSYLSSKKDYLMNILLYSYISRINKFSLDINLKSYILSNLEFSSIDLPKVNRENSLKKSLALSGISIKTKEKNEIFSTVKTKFIENNKYKNNKMIQFASLEFIIKELDFYNILKSVNFLENNENKLNKTRYNTITNIRSSLTKASILKKKKTAYLTMKKMKSTSRNLSSKNINNNNGGVISRQNNSLSILENKKFFKKENSKIIKKYRNSINANLFWYKLTTKKIFEKILPNPSVNIDISLQKEYNYMNKVISLIKERKLNKDLFFNKYDLLNQIKDKENIESILRFFIIEGEPMIFVEYFNNVFKKIDINSRDAEGNSFLILSVKSGMNYISKILLEKGINVNMQNLEGNSAFHFALSRKNFEMADLLKKFGAYEDIINKKGLSPWDCLGKSIENGNQ